jgi:hypothetical protein
MSRWNTLFKNQEFVQKIQGVLNLLEASEIGTITATEREEYERAIKLAS